MNIPGTGGFELGEIGQVADVDRAIAFYRDTLGMRFLFRAPPGQTSFGTLSARGAVFETEPHLVANLPDHELWMAFFRDPDGNLPALMSEVRP